MSCSLQLFIDLEKFVIRGYTPSNVTLVDNIAYLRWLLFSKYSCEVSKLYSLKLNFPGPLCCINT